MKAIKIKRFLKVFLLFIFIINISAFPEKGAVLLKKECTRNLLILANDLIKIQNHDSTNSNFGALYCKSCSDYHTRASESVLPFAVAYKVTGNKKYLNSALSTASWLIKQQNTDGSWYETPSKWTGTTTDQLLSLSAAYPILKEKLSKKQKEVWINSIKAASDWLVKKMNPVFASINYCATTTASLMVAFQIIHDSAYVKKAKDLAMVVLPKFDDDYFLTGEGNRIRGTKYGIDYGYDLDMSLWGLALYAKLVKDDLAKNYVTESLKRMIYFIYPDGSTDGSWGVRSSKWTTFGSFTADGSQILFALFAQVNPIYRTAALMNLNYFMMMRKNGLITFGPHYSDLFDQAPCIYTTFCRAKNLALAILYADENEGQTPKLPTQKPDWAKYFKTIDVALIRTKNFMLTVTGYRYKDIRRGSDFKYMFRPSGGSITNLWVEGYGYLQASSQTEYHRWEMNYPEIDSSITITPRIEFSDSNAYYTNLYEFDSHMELSDENGIYTVKATGELKDKNRWEGGVAYTLTHIISNNSIEKKIKLRFHGQKPDVKIIEPIVQNKNTKFKRIDDHTVEILGGKRGFTFNLLNKELKLEMGKNEKFYRQPFPSLKAYPIVINVKPDADGFIKEVNYRISIN